MLSMIKIQKKIKITTIKIIKYGYNQKYEEKGKPKFLFVGIFFVMLDFVSIMYFFCFYLVKVFILVNYYYIINFEK